MRTIVLAALAAFASRGAGQSRAIKAFVGDAYNFRALLAGGGLRVELGRSWLISAELMATAADARPNLSGEAEIRASNRALHALAGVGVALR